MNSLQMVAEFHRAFNHPIATQPQPLDTPLAKLRVSLITEEREELQQAIANNDKVGIVDAIQDLKYVVCGAALALGATIDVTIAPDLITGDEFVQDDLDQLTNDIDDLIAAVEHNDFLSFERSLDDVYSALIALSLDFGFADEAHFAAVHAANMRKVGGPVREDGKQLKPANWYGPEADHEQLLAA